MSQIDVQALTAAASEAHHGVQCRVPALTHDSRSSIDLDAIQSQAGGQNCHLDIHFEDGTVWLARIRLNNPLLPPEATQHQIFMSEIATYKFLEKTKVPVPRVYAYAFKSTSNPVGASYVLMEKLAGEPLQWYDATPAQRTRVMIQLVDIFIELERHPLSLAGSLCLDGDSIEVGGFAQSQLFTAPEKSVGPFDDVQASLDATVSQMQTQILNGGLSSFAVENYLSFCWRRDMIRHATNLCNETGSKSFFLKHGEDKGDHIMVDVDFNITGIIDWEFTTTEPKALAFSTPCMLFPVADFYDGRNDLSTEETEFAGLLEASGRHDLAKIVLASRKMQRLTWVNGVGGYRDKEEFRSLFTGVRAAWADCDTNEQVSSHEEWLADAKERYRNDAGLQSLLDMEESITDV